MEKFIDYLFAYVLVLAAIFFTVVVIGKLLGACA